METWRQRLHEHKHLVLLFALVGMCIAQPFARGMVGGLVIFDAVLTVVLLAIFFVIFKRKRDRQWALALALPAIIVQWSTYGLPTEAKWGAAIVHHSFILLFLSTAVAIILRGVFDETSIKFDHVIATICGYFIAGIAWGNAYQLVDLFVPNAYSIKPDIIHQLGEEHTRSFLFNYFSLSTLTGTGYGDITPIWPGVSSLTWMEAMFGQFYIAIVVAELIGLKLARSADLIADSPDSDQPSPPKDSAR